MKRKAEPDDEAKATASSSSQQPAVLPPFLCGCAGFANSKWVGNFYPSKLVGSGSSRQLDHYQQHFPVVEMNG